MWTTRARSVLSAVLLGAAAMFGGTGTAQAALYTGKWDPAYGSIFPVLGWSATAVIYVPDPCLASGDGNHLPTGVCAGFDVQSAQVEFYNIANPSSILATFNLNTDVDVNGISTAGGTLSGIDTSYFSYFTPALDIAGSGVYSFSLVLYGGDLAQLIYSNSTANSPFCGSFPTANTVCGVSANPARGVFTLTPVPEPETYLLMLAGLGAVGYGARRRRRS